jgi:hypothetical protein
MTGDRTGRPTRRRLLTGLAAAGTLGLGGCLTRSPTLDVRFPDSQVFESVTASEPWAALRIRVGIALTDRATTDLNVRTISIVDGNGYEYLEEGVTGGQTNLVTYLPLGMKVTVLALDNLGRTVERVRFSTAQ